MKKEFRQFLRDPGLPRLVMTFPVLIVFVFPFAVTMELRDIRLAVIDNDRSSESSLLVEKCVNSGYFILEDICPTPQAARSMMDKGDIDAVLIHQYLIDSYDKAKCSHSPYRPMLSYPKLSNP